MRPRIARVGGIRPAAAAIAIIVAIAGLVAARGAGGLPVSTPSPVIRIGAVFPLAGNAAGLAGQELAGVKAAVDLANAAGGIDGRPIVLDVRNLDTGSAAPVVMQSLRADGVSVVIGAYSSELSIPASTAAAAEGLVYWEAGAVADQLTGRGLPMVFRVGASGTNLGTNSASFAVSALAPRLGKAAAQLRIAIVAADDAYPTSVAAAATATATAAGAPIVAQLRYNAAAPIWAPVMTALAAARPDVIVLASHIPDGVAFRKAMLAAGVRAGALIGSTMAECDPDFAGDLGPDAIGIFASDRPIGGFQPSALDPQARQLYDRLAAAVAIAGSGSGTGAGAGAGGAGAGTLAPAGSDAWAGYGVVGGGSAGGGTGSGSGTSSSEYTIQGPIEEGSAAAGPTEEQLSGFSAAWVLVHDVLPSAAGGPDGVAGLTPTGIAAAARGVDLPVGSLPNGAGVRFSSDAATLGQNERAAAVIWQWQAVRRYAFVWPATYQTGSIAFVPLAR